LKEFRSYRKTFYESLWNKGLGSYKAYKWQKLNLTIKKKRIICIERDKSPKASGCMSQHVRAHKPTKHTKKTSTLRTQRNKTPNTATKEAAGCASFYVGLGSFGYLEGR
jgi:hypothetical protein